MLGLSLGFLAPQCPLCLPIDRWQMCFMLCMPCGRLQSLGWVVHHHRHQVSQPRMARFPPAIGSSIIPKDRNLMNETAEICWKIGTWLWRICGSIFRSSDYVQASSVLMFARAMPHRSPRTWTPTRYLKNYLDIFITFYWSWQHSQTSWKRWMSKRPGHDLHLDLTMDLRQAPVPVKT